jgi:hypothetical protein
MGILDETVTDQLSAPGDSHVTCPANQARGQSRPDSATWHRVLARQHRIYVSA